MHAIIYTRVSTIEQAELNKSLDTQEKACRDYAAKANFDVLQVFREEGESAKTADRTQLQAMLRFVAGNKGEVKHLIIWKIDRLARNAQDYGALVAAFTKLGVTLHSVTERLEATPAGRFMENVIASVAQFDNEVRSERSAKGMLARLQEGGWVHQAPIGYRNTRDEQGRPTLEPDEMAINVQRFLKDYAAGKLGRENAMHLAATQYGIKARGIYIKNGRKKTARNYTKPLAQSSAYRMLKNPLYAGLVTGKSLGEPIVGLHSKHALITPTEHRQILARLTNEESPDGVQASTVRPYATNKLAWPLRRFLKCKYCGHRLTGSRSRGKKGSHEYYHCTNCKGVRTKNGRHKHLTIKKEDVHRAFSKLLESIIPKGVTLELFRELFMRKWNLEFADKISRRKLIQDEITELDLQKKEYIEMARRKVVTDEELLEIKDDINARKTVLELDLLALQLELADISTMLDMAIDYMANAALLWDISKGDNKLRFQNMAIVGGIAIDEHLKFGTANLSPLFEQAHLLEKSIEQTKKTQNNSESLMVTARGIEPRLPG